MTDTAACCEVHRLGKCDAVFTCCDKCPTFFGKPATAAYGVRFLSDGSVAHPWNGRTQEQRAREYLAELRATYTRDRFALVIRDAPDQPWREVDE